MLGLGFLRARGRIEPDLMIALFVGEIKQAFGGPGGYWRR